MFLLIIQYVFNSKASIFIWFKWNWCLRIFPGFQVIYKLIQMEFYSPLDKTSLRESPCEGECKKALLAQFGCFPCFLHLWPVLNPSISRADHWTKCCTTVQAVNCVNSMGLDVFSSVEPKSHLCCVYFFLGKFADICELYNQTLLCTQWRVVITFLWGGER